MTVDLGPRKLRAFVAVAEELSFTRAAARLYVAQQALSQQVKHLEQELGVTLLERTSRRVTLTHAGEIFLAEARRMLADADAVIERVRATAGRRVVLRLGFTSGGIRPATRAVLAGFEAAFPHVEIELQEHPWSDPTAGLAGGSADVAVINLPNGLAGLDAVVVDRTEACAALPVEHPLADRDSLDVTELRQLPGVFYAVPPTSFFAVWNVGVEARRVRSIHEFIAAVATGRGVGVSSSMARSVYRAPGVAYRDLTGAPAIEIGFATRSETSSPVVRALLDWAGQSRTGLSA